MSRRIFFAIVAGSPASVADLPLVFDLATPAGFSQVNSIESQTKLVIRH